MASKRKARPTVVIASRVAPETSYYLRLRADALDLNVSQLICRLCEQAVDRPVKELEAWLGL